jgi:hypothetical protein
MPRLIRCFDCMTVEVLPDFLGSPTDESMDPLKSLVVVKHRGPLNRQQLHHRPSSAGRVRPIPDELIPCDLCRGSGCRVCEGRGKIQRFPHGVEQFVVQADDWINPDYRKGILQQMWGEDTGYPPEFYAAKDTFREDAGHCYNSHGRPGDPDKGPHACIDYQSSSKQLTDEGWKARGEIQGMPRRDIFLCDFCPFHQVVVMRKRAERGEYDK